MWVQSLPLLVLLAVAVTSSIVPSVAFGQPGDGPGRRGFYDLMRDIHRASPNREILDLLFHEPVRKEVEFSDESFDALKSNMKKSGESMMSLMSQAREGKLTRDQMREKILEAMKALDQQSVDLLQKKQFDRLVGLYVQHRGTAAAANDEVARRIELVGDDLEEFRKTRGRLKRELMDENAPRMERLLKIRDEDTSKNIERLFTEVNERVNEELAENLTATQRSKLKRLEGDVFKELPSHRFGRGPGPGFGGPDRGRGRPGDREHEEGGPLGRSGPHGPGERGEKPE